MTSLYVWLRFTHLLGLSIFLFGHGISGGASLVLRSRPALDVSRALLQLSVWSYRITYPGLLLLVATGVWMGFLGSWWGRGWIWASIAVLVATLVVMSALSVSYHGARDAAANDAQLAQKLASARPVPIAIVGALGVLALLFLMMFKPF